MKGIVFDYKIPKLALSKIMGLFSLKGYFVKGGAIQYKEVPDPKLIAEDWLIIRPEYCGICGSDTKQVFMDGNFDNPMTGIISWPQILGHEVVGYVEKVGKKVQRVKIGDRVALNPWLSCAPRGLELCEACKQGKNTLCRNFGKGDLAPGIHTGNSKDATGGFAELVPAHESMVFKIPDYITWDQAILSDPFSVAFHSILKVKPRENSICVVYGCGNLGQLSIHILKKIFKTKVIAITRFDHQKEFAIKMGADYCVHYKPESKIIEKIAEFTNSEIYYIDSSKRSHPWLIEGVDFVFDTVASPITLETGLRIIKARRTSEKFNNSMNKVVSERNIEKILSGTIIVTGVSSPKRFEWTPWYFKDIDIIGSNAFAIEDYNGIDNC